MPSSLGDQYLSADEAAHLLSVSRSRIYDMVERQQLPALRFGRAIRIPMTGLDDLTSRSVARVVDSSPALTPRQRQPNAGPTVSGDVRRQRDIVVRSDGVIQGRKVGPNQGRRPFERSDRPGTWRVKYRDEKGILRNKDISGRDAEAQAWALFNATQEAPGAVPLLDRFVDDVWIEWFDRRRPNGDRAQRLAWKALLVKMLSEDERRLRSFYLNPALATTFRDRLQAKANEQGRGWGWYQSLIARLNRLGFALASPIYGGLFRVNPFGGLDPIIPPEKELGDDDYGDLEDEDEDIPPTERIDEAMVIRMLAASAGTHIFPPLVASLHGIRAAELRPLRVGNFDRADGRLKIVRQAKKDGTMTKPKTKSSRRIIRLSEVGRQIIVAMLEAREAELGYPLPRKAYLFVSGLDQRWTSGGLLRAFRQISGAQDFVWTPKYGRHAWMNLARPLVKKEHRDGWTGHISVGYIAAISALVGTAITENNVDRLYGNSLPEPLREHVREAMEPTLDKLLTPHADAPIALKAPVWERGRLKDLARAAARGRRLCANTLRPPHYFEGGRTDRIYCSERCLRQMIKKRYNERHRKPKLEPELEMIPCAGPDCQATVTRPLLGPGSRRRFCSQRCAHRSYYQANRERIRATVTAARWAERELFNARRRERYKRKKQQQTRNALVAA